MTTNPWPLWLRISATLVCAMIVVAIISTKLGMHQRESDIREQLETQSWRTIEVLSAGALEAVISEDIALLDSLVNEITELDKDIYSIVISNEYGHNLVDHTASDRALPDGAYTYRHQIEFEGEVFGTVVASWDPTRLLNEVDSRLAREQIQLILSLLTLTLLSLILLHVLVVAPMNKLRDRLLAHSVGQTPQPLTLRSSREMAMLAEAVNELGQAVDDSRALTQELEYQANHDMLTGLANRSAFEAALKQRLKERRETDIEDIMFYLDLDQFKIVNDTSVGVVPISGTGYTVEGVLAAADEACYAAKDAGRNRVHVYQEQDNAVSQRRSEMSWVPRVRDAIENSRLILFGQEIRPTMPSRNDNRRLEVLVRMLSEDGSSVLPGAFLPAAERYGLVQQIDRWVVNNVLDWLAGCINRGEDPPICAINLSGNSISDNEFCQFVLETLREASVPAQLICFEVTETAAVANLATATKFMQLVKKLGCSFALDDFGAGMSSFTYLKNLPVDYIKIDGSIVRDLVNDDTSVVMVRAIGDIARVMGIQSIAEFVENDEIGQKISEIGIDYAQGYAIGHPQPLSTFEQKRSPLRKAG